MAKRGKGELLSDIKEAIRRIESYTKGVSYAAFLKDLKVQDAVVRNFEIIGEAVKNLPADFKYLHHTVDWKNIAGLRDKLIHHYFGVNWDIVWSVVKEKLPEFKVQLEKL